MTANQIAKAQEIAANLRERAVNPAKARAEVIELINRTIEHLQEAARAVEHSAERRSGYYGLPTCQFSNATASLIQAQERSAKLAGQLELLENFDLLNAFAELSA